MPANGGGTPGEDEEGSLEGVLGVGRVIQHTPADSEHHRPVPFHQTGEGVFIAIIDETVEKLAIGPGRFGMRIGTGKAAKLLQDRRELTLRHDSSLGPHPLERKSDMTGCGIFWKSLWPDGGSGS